MVAVYTVISDVYFEYGYVMVYSFFKNNPWFDGDFLIINDDKYVILSESNKRRLQKISNRIKFLNLFSEKYKPVLDNQASICGNDKLVCCFYKLEIFRDNKYDKVLYLDSVIVVNGSLEELFKREDTDGKFCACLDVVASDKTYIRESDKDYFNGGMYLLDNEVIKKYPFEKMFKICSEVTKEEIKESIRAKNDGLCVDQDIFNFIIKDEDTLILPSLYYNVNHCMKKYDSVKTKIYHYYGPSNKPNGKMDRLGKDKWFFDPWHKYYDETLGKPANVLCRDSKRVWCVYFGAPYKTVFNVSKYNLSKVRLIDIRALNVEYYRGFEKNEHHITTESYYKLILPYLSLHMFTFKFNINDFKMVDYFTKDKRHNCSYLKPLKKMKFTMYINGKMVAEHGNFESITRTKTKWDDSELYKYYAPGNIPADSEYHNLLRGSHACCRIINETVDNNLKLLVSGDSMMIPTIPIFASYYKEVVYMDNRDNKSHREYVEDVIFDEVLFCPYEDSQFNKVTEINLK